MPKRDVSGQDLGAGAVDAGALGGAGTIGVGGLSPGAVGAGAVQSGSPAKKATAAKKKPGSTAAKKTNATMAARGTSAQDGSSITPLGVGDPLRVAAEKYPSLAGLLGIPEIADKIRAAVLEGWTAEKMAAEVQSTAWWRGTPSERRAWIALEAIDPASAARKVAGIRDEIQAAARDYAVRMDRAAIDRWARSVASGEVAADEYRAYLVEQATSAYPGLAAALQRGITVAQYAAPYAAVAADELGLTAADIDFSDPKWNAAINAVDPKTGERRALTLADWQSELRRNDVYGWDRTPNARKQAAEFAMTLARTFGGM